MSSVVTGVRRTRRISRGPLRVASARVVMRSIPTAFADAIANMPVRRVTVVSPWLTDTQGGCDAFRRIVTWAAACDARIQVLTREPAPNNEPHRRALQAVLAASGSVTVNPSLHAKIFIAEFRNNARVAAVGSANFTVGADELLETALLITSAPCRRGPDLIDDLLAGPVRAFARDSASRRLTSA